MPRRRRRNMLRVPMRYDAATLMPYFVAPRRCNMPMPRRKDECRKHTTCRVLEHAYSTIIARCYAVATRRHVYRARQTLFPRHVLRHATSSPRHATPDEYTTSFNECHRSFYVYRVSA